MNGTATPVFETDIGSGKWQLYNVRVSCEEHGQLGTGQLIRTPHVCQYGDCEGTTDVIGRFAIGDVFYPLPSFEPYHCPRACGNELTIEAV